MTSDLWGEAGAGTPQDRPSAEASLAGAADAWLESLYPSDRRAALHAYDGRHRENFRTMPTGLRGVAIRDMTPDQRQAARRALEAGLSEEGFGKAEAIMQLEPFVRMRADEGNLLQRLTRNMRDPGRYYLAIFGEPDEATPWGMRFEGHHLSMSFTAMPGAPLSSTPLFMGAEPRRIPDGHPGAGTRVLGEEEDRGRALYLALTESQRAEATLPLQTTSGAFQQNRPLFVGDAVHLEAPVPRGLPRARMDAEQAALLDAVIETGLSSFLPEVAAVHRRKMDDAGRGAIRFAWAGGTSPDVPLYYRVQGPTFLVEFDNTTPNADHVHAIFRDLTGDFGGDPLAAHYTAHAHGRAAEGTPALPNPDGFAAAGALAEGAKGSKPQRLEATRPREPSGLAEVHPD